MTEIDVTPVPVSLKSSDVKFDVNMGLPSKPCISTILYSMLLDSAGVLGPMFRRILKQDALRQRAFLIAYDNPVLLCDVNPAVAPEPSTPTSRPTGFLLCPTSAQYAQQSYFNEGTVNAPAANGVITSVTVPAGTYTINWITHNVNAPTTVNNFGVLVNGTLIADGSANSGTALELQNPLEVTVGQTSNTIAIVAVAADTVAGYYGELTVTPVNAWDVGPGSVEINGQNEIWAVATNGTARISVLEERAVNE